jgi:hypothetical protein
MATRFLCQQVYFIQSGDCGPIGIAEDPLKRLRHLQTGSCESLRLLGILPGGAEREASLHRHLAEFRIRGEWFRPSPEVLASVPGDNLQPLMTALGVSREGAATYKLRQVMKERLANGKDACDGRA